MPRTPSPTPPKRHDPWIWATSPQPRAKRLCAPLREAKEAAPATTEAKEETKEEAQDKMPAREPVRMRRAKAWDVDVENAYRFQCAGWRSAVRMRRPAVLRRLHRRPAQEEYAQGEYGDEISWFSDSGLVEKVQNRQGLFMYFKRRGGGVRSGTSSSMASLRRRGAWLGLAVAVR